MANGKDEIKIITGPPATALASKPEDILPREGVSPKEEDHFNLPKIKFFTKKPVEQITNQIEELKGTISKVVTTLSQCVVEKTELDEVTVGLAVSVEGDVGIASAGAEVSIELTYKIKR